MKNNYPLGSYFVIKYGPWGNEDLSLDYFINYYLPAKLLWKGKDHCLLTKEADNVFELGKREKNNKNFFLRYKALSDMYAYVNLDYFER